MAVNVTCDRCGKRFGGLGRGDIWLSVKQTSRNLGPEKLFGDLCPECSTELVKLVQKWCPGLSQFSALGDV